MRLPLAFSIALVVGCTGAAPSPGAPHDASPAADSDAPAGPDSIAVGCTPGRVEACPCPGAPGGGAQTCLPSGTFGACVCSSTDAGGDVSADVGPDALALDAPQLGDVSGDVATDATGDASTDSSSGLLPTIDGDPLTFRATVPTVEVWSLARTTPPLLPSLPLERPPLTASCTASAAPPSTGLPLTYAATFAGFSLAGAVYQRSDDNRSTATADDGGANTVHPSAVQLGAVYTVDGVRRVNLRATVHHSLFTGFGGEPVYVYVVGCELR